MSDSIFCNSSAMLVAATISFPCHIPNYFDRSLNSGMWVNGWDLCSDISFTTNIDPEDPKSFSFTISSKNLPNRVYCPHTYLVLTNFCPSISFDAILDGKGFQVFFPELFFGSRKPPHDSGSRKSRSNPKIVTRHSDHLKIPNRFHLTQHLSTRFQQIPCCQYQPLSATFAVFLHLLVLQYLECLDFRSGLAILAVELRDRI